MFVLSLLFFLILVVNTERDGNFSYLLIHFPNAFSTPDLNQAEAQGQECGSPMWMDGEDLTLQAPPAPSRGHRNRKLGLGAQLGLVSRGPDMGRRLPAGSLTATPNACFLIQCCILSSNEMVKEIMPEKSSN